jgi:diaminohydroxyphosphoribosylaminopyrimidine deaminase/5-amino-6-(5-phosphoribosylamino)uracil reductase
MKYEVRDELYMMRCLQLATMAEGQTSPNPMVGAVIVYDGRIIGEGYHHRAGEPHAEPNAIASVKDESLLREAAMYVSLEPCSHWGKTPPCADLIVRKGLKRVVIATLDPNPKVAGRGVKILQDAGIEVTVGVMEEEARWLNRRFMTVQEKHRPYVILKWAETEDGIIDVCREEKGSGPIKISNSVTKTLNHQVRVEEDAIMVATKTALLDDPHLTVTKWTGRNPVRVLLDRSLRVPADYRIFDEAARTIVFCSQQSTVNSQRLVGDNVEFVGIDFEGDIVQSVMDELYKRGVMSIIIEGGAKWLQTVIDSGLWDEARVERGPHSIRCIMHNAKCTIEEAQKLSQNGVKAPKIV